MMEDEYPVNSHYIPKQDYIEKEEVKSWFGLLKRIINPQPAIKVVHLSNPDFYPAYKSEREERFRAEKEVKELREELYNLRVKHMKEKDELDHRIFELEEENDRLNALVELECGQYL